MHTIDNLHRPNEMDDLLVQAAESLGEERKDNFLSKPNDRIIREADRLAARSRREYKQRARKKRLELRKQSDAAIALQHIKDPEQARVYDLAAYKILAPMMEMLDGKVTEVVSRSSRYLHTWTDDLHDKVLDRMRHEIVRTLKKRKESEGKKGWSPEALYEASLYLGQFRFPPNEVHLEDEAAQKAGKWLLGVAHNATLDALRHHLREHDTLSLEQLAAVEATGSLHGVDDYLSHAHADRQEGAVGGRFVGPGQVDWSIVAAMVSEGITANRLDRVTEVMLDEEYLRTDGAFLWTEHASKVWDALGLDPEVLVEIGGARMQAQFVREVMQRLFAFLPDTMATTIQALEEMRPATKVTQAILPDTPANVRAREAAQAIAAVLG